MGVSLLDSGFRRNDDHLDPLVIPAKAGIQKSSPKKHYPELLRRYDAVLINNQKGEKNEYPRG